MENILNQTYPFKNEPLPYGYGGLEPYIDAKTMMLHHDRHLQAYIDNLNKYIETKPEMQGMTLEQLLTRFPDDIEINHNAGGVYNHAFFFAGLRRGSSQIVVGLSGRLLQLITRDFGTLENMKNQFNSAAMSVFGSGYAWLCVDPHGRLVIVTTANQDVPFVPTSGLKPLLNVDVWEHAYYLKHYNLRADYLRDFWNVVDWVRVSNRLDNCLTMG